MTAACLSGKCFQRVDADHFGADGIRKSLGRRDADPQAGERAGPDRDGNQLDRFRRPVSFGQQLLNSRRERLGRSLVARSAAI